MKFNLYYLLIISILICSKGLSQKNTYRIIHKNKTSNLLEFRVAIEKADFNKMRFKTKRREITFLNGPTIELLSAQELISKGFKIELSECIDESSLNDNNTWKLDPNGYIIQVISMNNKTAFIK